VSDQGLAELLDDAEARVAAARAALQAALAESEAQLKQARADRNAAARGSAYTIAHRVYLEAQGRMRQARLAARWAP
jgi:hypothetical protein